MRCSAKTTKLLLCMLLGTFGATGATAGSFNTPLEHVIIVIQENRTPDNLFGADQALINAGARVDLAGSCHGKDIPLTAWQLDACFNPDHSHNPAWLDQYHGGAMDGSCSNQVTLAHCNKAQLPLCPKGNHQKYCPAYTYVSNADGLLDPYFEIAAQYGFANYMFQTNQGPSFPAHQFLFSGTSAPVGYPNQYFDWFAAENAGRSVGNYGCIGSARALVAEMDPSTGQEAPGYKPPYPQPADTSGFPCYEHGTLTDVLDSAGVSWRYYSDSEGSFWTAPNAIHHICQEAGQHCTGPDWPPNGTKITFAPSQVLSDLGVNGTGPDNCNLQQVSWVIPDGHWSDHPGSVGHDGGPSWVAAIVNAVGGYDNSGALLPFQCNYWANTAILIVWDDWGGFYDGVNPIDTIGRGTPGYPGGGGNGSQYVYGFRVPLLVVSPYALPGYISGPKNNPVCPNYYCHDFGSILRFVEYAFGENNRTLGPISSPQWPYADAFAQDVGTAPNEFALRDFFQFKGEPRSFTPITGAKYSSSCFLDPSSCFKSFHREAPDSD